MKKPSSTPLLILIFLISLSFTPSLAATKPSTTTTTTTTTTTFIKRCCTTTSYPKLCYATLYKYAAQIQNNPKRLATKSLAVALIEAKSAALTTSRLSRVRGLKPKVRAALSDCTMAVENSAAQLQRSMLELGKAPVWTQMEESDVQTWTSTALTYAETCREAFDGNDMNGSVKNMVQRKIGKLSQMTSNALALVNRYYVSAAMKSHHHNNHP